MPSDRRLNVQITRGSMLGNNDIVHSDAIVERFEADEFDLAADAILAKRGTAKLKPPPAPPEPRGPERYEIAEPGDTLASAFEKGVEAGCANMAACCGCSGTGPITNPFDGSEIQ